jgi:hypothetical protein
MAARCLRTGYSAKAPVDFGMDSRSHLGPS